MVVDLEIKKSIFDKKIITYIFEGLTRRKILYYLWLILTKGDISSARSVITTHLRNIIITGIDTDVLSQVDGENFGYRNRVEISYSMSVPSQKVLVYML